MNALLFVKGLIGLVVFVAALGALITQLQIRTKIPTIPGVKASALRVWHRWLGRVALWGFVLNSMLCLLVGFYPAPRGDPRHLVHSLLSVICAVVFLGKIWITRRKIRWGLRRIVPLGATLFILHVGVFLTATVFAVWVRVAGLV